MTVTEEVFEKALTAALDALDENELAVPMYVEYALALRAALPILHAGFVDQAQQALVQLRDRHRGVVRLRPGSRTATELRCESCNQQAPCDTRRTAERGLDRA